MEHGGGPMKRIIRLSDIEAHPRKSLSARDYLVENGDRPPEGHRAILKELAALIAGIALVLYIVAMLGHMAGRFVGAG